MSGEEIDDAIASMAADSPLWDGCHYIVSSPGKRFRASLAHDAAHYGGRPDDPWVERAAVAIELFHAATLAHDDVVDDGRMRRGKPAIGAASGNLAASLAGGWLFARASELVAEFGDEAAARFAETAAAVCEGEMLELGDLHDVDRTRERYLDAIRMKTASLIAFAGWLGARAGGSDAEAAECLWLYGEAVGMAFQISDDVMDLLADERETGKTPGSDLRQGVYTLPVIYALEVDPALREALLRGPEEEELPALVDRVIATGAIDRVLAEGAEWVSRAGSSLPRLEPQPEHERQLLLLAGSVVERIPQVVAT